MTTIWVLAEAAPDGALSRASAEHATLARSLAASGVGLDAAGIVVGTDPGRLASALAAYLPRVVAVTDPSLGDAVWAVPAAEQAAAVIGTVPAWVFTSTTADGRDAAGALSALLGAGVLANAMSVGWADGPTSETTVFGGKLITISGFTGASGIVTVDAGVVTAAPAAGVGVIEQRGAAGARSQPVVSVVAREAASGGAVSLEEARAIVSGGRGVGGPDGFGLVRDLAAALGGAVAASRAAVDSGWIPYSHQVGQTGKIVKPALYLALGISGAIQHKVGMQGSGFVVAVNRDPDAPIAEFADILVLGDLFEIGPAILAELRARPA